VVDEAATSMLNAVGGDLVVALLLMRVRDVSVRNLKADRGHVGGEERRDGCAVREAQGRMGEGRDKQIFGRVAFVALRPLAIVFCPN
jgi:hypothetical protein